MAGEPPRVRLADMADAKRENETIERHVPPRLDRTKKISDRGLAIALAIFELLKAARIARLQGENIGGRHDEPVAIELLDLLLAKPLDVEGIARHEMFQALHRLRRADEAAGSAAHDIGGPGLFINLADRRRAADRADLRKFIRL